MSVNSIAETMAAFNPPTFKSATQLKQPVKGTAVSAVSSKVQEEPVKAPDALKETASAVADNNTGRGMSHISESYDSRGNVITKYMDSSNNLIYQTPSEQVVKTRELMTNTQAAKNIKG